MRPEHFYTDEDYAWMKKVWREEKIQGEIPRYWEDVKIGDMVTPVLEDPIIESVLPTAPYGMGIGGMRTMKEEITGSVWIEGSAEVELPSRNKI